MSKEEDLKQYNISNERPSVKESIKAERDARTVQHHHTDYKNTWPLTIPEKRMPEFRRHVEAQIPEFVDSDLPLENVLTERHLNEMEKRLGRSFQEINEAMRSFNEA